MMNNKWKHGKAHFELGGVPSALTELHGIRPIPIILDDSGNVINFFEFPNQYGLKDTIDQVKAACENLEVLDFMQAKSEYEHRYTIDQLLKI